MFFKTEISADRLPVATLAYVGDAVYELCARNYLVSRKELSRTEKLHLLAVSLVRAESQARAIGHLLPILTDLEKDFIRKGRNAKNGSRPKNTEVISCRLSTGLECLFGYLYLKGQEKRLQEISSHIYEFILREGDS